MQVWKQWTNEHRTTQKTGRGRRKAVGTMLVYCYRCTKVGIVNSSTSAPRVPLYRITLMANHRRLRMQWAHEQMNCASICGTMIAAFVLVATAVNAAFQIVLSNYIVA
ncbi:hypothetical protein TNCV_4602481 [Trichonephila clavipes]|nr:hypothetical protein TNCV_4602481 [Trichonephila clavipes]